MMSRLEEKQHIIWDFDETLTPVLGTPGISISPSNLSSLSTDKLQQLELIRKKLRALKTETRHTLLQFNKMLAAKMKGDINKGCIVSIASCKYSSYMLLLYLDEIVGLDEAILGKIQIVSFIPEEDVPNKNHHIQLCLDLSGEFVTDPRKIMLIADNTKNITGAQALGYSGVNFIKSLPAATSSVEEVKLITISPKATLGRRLDALSSYARAKKILRLQDLLTSLEKISDMTDEKLSITSALVKVVLQPGSDTIQAFKNAAVILPIQSEVTNFIDSITPSTPETEIKSISSPSLLQPSQDDSHAPPIPQTEERLLGNDDQQDQDPDEDLSLQYALLASATNETENDAKTALNADSDLQHALLKSLKDQTENDAKATEKKLIELNEILPSSIKSEITARIKSYNHDFSLFTSRRNIKKLFLEEITQAESIKDIYLLIESKNTNLSLVESGYFRHKTKDMLKAMSQKDRTLGEIIKVKLLLETLQQEKKYSLFFGAVKASKIAFLKAALNIKANYPNQDWETIFNNLFANGDHNKNQVFSGCASRVKKLVDKLNHGNASPIAALSPPKQP